MALTLPGTLTWGNRGVGGGRGPRPVGAAASSVQGGRSPAAAACPAPFALPRVLGKQLGPAFLGALQLASRAGRAGMAAMVIRGGLDGQGGRLLAGSGAQRLADRLLGPEGRILHLNTKRLQRAGQKPLNNGLA